MLAVKPTPSRMVMSLDGVWDFKLDQDDEGVGAQWNTRRLYAPRPMPVPSSYNDITLDMEVHTNAGPVWYQREITIPLGFANQSILLRFEGVTHNARVFINDTEVASHTGGYLPFEADITEVVDPGETYLLSVWVDNRHAWGQTLPGGTTHKRGEDLLKNVSLYNSFDYSGINQSVYLYARPRVAVQDISFKTSVLIPTTEGGFESATCKYEVELTEDADDETEVTVELVSFRGNVMAQAEGLSGELYVENPGLWSPEVPYLYTLRVTADDDIYEQSVGIRTLQVVDNEILLNGNSLYLMGFSRQQDSPLRGAGSDNVSMVHDFELMRWMGANCFMPKGVSATPEELELADKLGFLVIQEAPAFGFGTGEAPAENDADAANDDAEADATNDAEAIAAKNSRPVNTVVASQELMKQAVTEMIARDKNHPSVIAWSVAYEPVTRNKEAAQVLVETMELARELDPARRPVSFVAAAHTTPKDKEALQAADIFLLNRFHGWDSDTGELYESSRNLDKELILFEEHYTKPIIFTSFGAHALPGRRSLYEDAWSEDYQVSLLANLGAIFDRHDCVQGELAGALADYKLAEDPNSPDICYLGLFTREREPKTAAYTIRVRWLLQSGKSVQ